MKNFLKNKKILLLAIVLLSAVVVFGGVESVQAVDWLGAGASVGHALKGFWLYIIIFITDAIVLVEGTIVTVVVQGIIKISAYNNFIHEGAIVTAWTVIRDFCNMFFILVLLLIAFATILRYENYSIKKLLPKLIIMAVLINFSRTICGLIIDFAQVIMLTFVDAIGNTGGNYVDALGVKHYLEITTKKVAGGGNLDVKSVMAGLLLGIIFLAIAAVVYIVVLGVLVARIVMLWIYVVLSPLAFLLSAFPGGQSYASRWWDDFIKNVIVGPVLMFFIWLALIAVGSQNSVIKASGNAACSTDWSALCPQQFIGFIIAIGMLMGGLTIAQSLGGMAGAAAGKGMGAIQKGRGLAWKATKSGADWVNRGTVGKWTPVDLNLKRVGAKIGASFDRGKTQDLREMNERATTQLKKGGFKGVLGFGSADFGDNYLKGTFGRKGVSQMLHGGKINVNNHKKEKERLAEKAKYTLTKDEHKDRLKVLHDKQAQNMNKYRKKEITEKAFDNATKEYDEEIEKLSEKNIDFKDSLKEAEAARSELMSQSEKEGFLAAKYGISDNESAIEARMAVAEEQRKITSTNEDELASDFQKAIALNNKSQATAIAQAITKIGGGNALLNKFGYQAKSGLTEDEAKIAKADGTYDQKKGFNDFMREVFGGQLKMNKQEYLRAQNDIAGIAEAGGAHEYMTKPVSVDSQGELYQTESKKREQVKLVEKFKKEREKVIRNNNRTEYGAENNTTGEFEWSDSGLAYFIAQRDTISNEIRKARFNTSSAKAVIEPKAMAALEKKVADAGITHYKDKNGKDREIKYWIQELKNYGAKVSTEAQENLL